MQILAVVLSAVALLLALISLLRARAASDALEDARRDSRRMLSELERDFGAQITLLRQFVARLAEGGKLTADMIREGVAWRSVDPSDAEQMIESEKPVVLDVRTPPEVASGYLPHAVLIPMDEIEHRLDEVPRPTDRPLLVYCEGGVRSAAICDYLAQEGWEDLCNLSGGIASWRGPLERPS